MLQILSTTAEPVGRRNDPFLAKEGNYHGIQAGEHVVGAVGAEGEWGGLVGALFAHINNNPSLIVVATPHIQ